MGNALELIADLRDKKTQDELFYNGHHLNWGPIYKFNLSKHLLSVTIHPYVYTNAGRLVPLFLVHSQWVRRMSLWLCLRR